VAKVVAVDDDLRGLKEALAAQGYSVVGLDERQMERADAVVISGMEQNLMLMEDIKTRVPVISAAGRTNEEILKDLEEYFKEVH